MFNIISVIISLAKKHNMKCVPAETSCILIKDNLPHNHVITKSILNIVTSCNIASTFDKGNAERNLGVTVKCLYT
jgi:hypothetical protein